MARKAKVNVNKADRDELAAVPGIGRSTADAMVKLRFERGGFKRLDELAEVPGIGEQTLEGLRKHVTVSTNGEARAEPAKKAATSVEKPATSVERGVDAARRTADKGAETAEKGAATATKAVEAGADVAKETAAAQAEVGAKQAETAKAVATSAQEQVASAHARQRETVQTAVASGNALFETMREANQAWLGFVQDQIWANVQTAQMLARCRSPQDVIEVQSSYVRSSLERLVEEQVRFADLATRMATRTVRPAR